MRRFFVRELARLAPVAVASLFLGLLVYLGLTLLAPASWTHGAADYTYLIVLLGAPWLLGAAAIAPDAENGALTFMATLPVRPWRSLLARLGAAGLYALAVPGLTFLALTPAAAGARPTWLNLQLGPEALVPFVFAGAVLASATIRNALAAFMLAPVFAAVPFWWVLRVGDFWRWPELSTWLFMPLPLFLLAGAWAAFARGDHVGRLWSPRSLRLGAAVALTPLLLLSGLSSAVGAYDFSGAWHVESSYHSADGAVELAFLREETRLTGRQVLEMRDAWCYRAEGGELLPLEGRLPVAISPDGRSLLTTSPTWWSHEGEVPVELVDLRADRYEKGDPAPRPVALTSISTRTWPRRSRPYPSGLPGVGREDLPLRGVLDPVCWREQPYLVTASGLEGFDGTQLPWPVGSEGGAELEVLDVAGAVVLLRERCEGGPRIWVWGAKGIWVLPQRPGADDADATWPDSGSWGLSPQGHWVLAQGRRAGDTAGAGCLAVIQASPVADWLGPWPLESSPGSTWFHAQFSPAEDYLAIQRFDEAYLQVRALHDAGRLDVERGGAGHFPPVFWTPGGELVVEGEAWYRPDPKGTLILQGYPPEPARLENLTRIATGAGPRLIYAGGGSSGRGPAWAFDLSTGRLDEVSNDAIPDALD